MGQSPSALLDDDRRVAQNDWKEAVDALNAVNIIALEKQKVFKYRLAKKDDFEFPAIPIDRVLYTNMIQRAAMEDEATDLTQEIANAIGNFVSGAFLDSVTRAIRKDLDTLFANYLGNGSEVQHSLVSVSPTLGVFRIDYNMYSYRFQSDTLKRITKSITMISFAISSVDMSNLNANTCNVIVSQAFGTFPADQQKALAQDLVAAVEKSKLEQSKAEKPAGSVPGIASVAV